MKKYKLKQWYPSLGGDFKNGEKIIFCEERGCYVKNFGDDISLRKTEVENNPDFWELIEEGKPLFITEDGVEITDGMQSVIAIDSDINVEHTRYQWANKKDLIFAHESNADEYILWNKPLLSLQEIDATVEGCLPEFDELIKLAKARIEEL